MKVIYSVDWLTRLSVWISPLVPSWRCFLPHVDFFILTSHFTPLIVSPPLLSSHSPSPSVSPSPPVIQQHITTACFRNGIVHYLTVSVQRGASSSFCLHHTREDKGRIRRRREAIDKDCWRRRDGGRESGVKIGWMCENHREGKRVKALPSHHLSVCFISWLPLSDRLKEAPSLCLTVSITLQQPD